MDNKRTIKAAIAPYKRESTYSNIFSFPVLIFLFGYLCFNFYLEWNNWDTLLERASSPPPHQNSSTLERWMVVDVDNSAAVGIVRLEQVCKNLEIFDAIFAVLCLVVPLLSVVRFLMRQEKVLYESLKCKNRSCQWFAGVVFLAALRAVEATVAFVLMAMLLPSSFFMCYRLVAMYFCTLVFGIFMAFVITIVLTSAVSHSVLVFDVNYTSLGVMGREQEIDVVETKRRPRRRRTDYKDDESEALVQEPYSDGLNEEDKAYIDDTV
tara:strand:+ start:3396 stop:4193 length:798 start_codon:yes stop_codon:yes gene_type:complete